MIDFLDSCIYIAIKAIIGLIIISIVLSIILGIIALIVKNWVTVISFLILLICVAIGYASIHYLDSCAEKKFPKDKQEENK